MQGDSSQRKVGRPKLSNPKIRPANKFPNQFWPKFIEKVDPLFKHVKEDFHIEIKFRSNNSFHDGALLIFFELVRIFKLQKRCQMIIKEMSVFLKEWQISQTHSELKKYLQGINVSFLSDAFEFARKSQYQLASKAISERRNEQIHCRKKKVQKRIQLNTKIIKKYISQYSNFQNYQNKENNSIKQVVIEDIYQKIEKQESQTYQTQLQPFSDQVMVDSPISSHSSLILGLYQFSYKEQCSE